MEFQIPTGSSPNRTIDSNACYVILDGVVYYGVGNDVDWDSCGRTFALRSRILPADYFL